MLLPVLGNILLSLRTTPVSRPRTQLSIETADQLTDEFPNLQQSRCSKNIYYPMENNSVPISWSTGAKSSGTIPKKDNPECLLRATITGSETTTNRGVASKSHQTDQQKTKANKTGSWASSMKKVTYIPTEMDIFKAMVETEDKVLKEPVEDSVMFLTLSEFSRLRRQRSYMTWRLHLRHTVEESCELVAYSKESLRHTPLLLDAQHIFSRDS